MRTAALVLSTVLISTSALASASAPPNDQIVVHGSRPAQKEIRDFVKSLTIAPSWGQIGRFHSAVCPVAMGLTAPQNARIAERMRLVAVAASIPVARAKCTPNVFVIVSPDRKWAITEIGRRFPAFIEDLPDDRLRHLVADPSPASAWQVKSLRSAYNDLLEQPAGRDYYRVVNSNPPSRVRANSMPTFVASLVVIDRRSAGGLTVTQLADYAAMRTFADTDPARVASAAAPSILPILTLPADAPLPQTLTHWDLAFLKALYSTSNVYYAAYQRGDIEQLVRKELEQAAGRPR